MQSKVGISLQHQVDRESSLHLIHIVLAQILGWRETAIPRPEIFYWRTSVGDEVDFVIETGGRLLPVEVKASACPVRKKLIEVALPREAINKAGAREESIRHGHPSTLHLWWAQRLGLEAYASDKGN